ncbi:alpha/beta fold hydrolase [Ectopseudomonas khazarica]|uniref:alpha/beta fold hydrolase n=1 Tax=Ectopseudomonas khazarica TaxID=2502979 RepID=UPI002FE0F313
MQLNAFDLEVRGLVAKCWEAGKGTPLLLLHGSGPGAAAFGTWRFVLEPLAEHFNVFIMDMFGFGGSAKKPEGEPFDLELWMDQVRALVAHTGRDEIYVIGHSISGYLALRLAAEDARVKALVTTGTMGEHFECNAETEKCWTFPETREALKSTLTGLMFDTSVITDELLDLRMDILHDGVYGPYFTRMFQGNKQSYIDEATLTGEEFEQIKCPTLLIHGRNDVMFPAEELTLKIAEHLPHADVLLLGACAHLPATEHPERVVREVMAFFKKHNLS